MEHPKLLYISRNTDTIHQTVRALKIKFFVVQIFNYASPEGFALSSSNIAYLFTRKYCLQLINIIDLQ